MGRAADFPTGQRRFEQLVSDWSVVDFRKRVIVARYAVVDLEDKE